MWAARVAIGYGAGRELALRNESERAHDTVTGMNNIALDTQLDGGDEDRDAIDGQVR